MPQREGTSRRTVLRGVGAIGVGGAAAAALAACGPGGGSAGQAAPSAVADIAKTTDIPVGGGKIFADELIVITQPTAGTFKAFSAVCTHEQCTLNQIQNGQIECPCHGSQYSIVDGSVTVPAVPGSHQRPLPRKTVTISGDEISIS